MAARIRELGNCVFLKLNVNLIRFRIQQIDDRVANIKTNNKTCHSYVKTLREVYGPCSTISRNQLVYHMNRFGFTELKLYEILFNIFLKEFENCTKGYILVLENGLIFNMYQSIEELEQVISNVLELISKYEISK